MEYSSEGIKKSIGEFWGKLSLSQKVLTIGAPLLVGIVLLGLVFWASRPQYEAIFTKQSASEAGAIIEKLKELKVDYKLEDNGTTILVPEADAAEVRLELANSGLPKGSTFSFDSLNEMHLGETDEDRKLRYTLGLQNELEITLETLQGVQDARVHIVMPEPSLFAETQKETTAAVTLKLAPGTKLSDEQIRAVANLVAGSVEGLQPGNITIIDTEGTVLSDSLGDSNDPSRLTGSQLQFQQAVEDDIENSVQGMLDRVFGPGTTVVRANATLDFDQKTIIQQTNGQGALVSKQSSTESSTNSSGDSAAVPGVGTNVPGYEVDTGSNGSISESNKSTTTENYQVDTTQEERVVSPGQVQRLSVSVMADADSVTEEQLVQIEDIVASAAGINPERGDQIVVTAIPFNKAGIQEEKAAMAEAARKQQLVQYAELGSAVLLALVFLLILLRTKSKSRRKATARILDRELQPIPLAAAEELLASQQQAEAEAKFRIAQKQVKSTQEIEKQKIKEAVDQYTRRNPDEVARLMKTWLVAEDK